MDNSEDHINKMDVIDYLSQLIKPFGDNFSKIYKLMIEMGDIDREKIHER